ncbi:MAG TPA: hypothetical protein VMU04_04885 [Candidatus Acidoferrum sp.]|nr:hypothetical protein [Candidatus Acidoferrum sp.]
MTSRTLRWVWLAALVCGVGWLVWGIASIASPPIALLHVLDSARRPVAGAVIKPEGLRTKPGTYASGWYSWQADKNHVPNTPVTTDANGYARVPYPKYVMERLETGVLCLSVEHPDFVPARPEVRVAFAPPAGAPWRIRADYLWSRLQAKALVDRPDPILLYKGAVLELAVTPDSPAPHHTPLFAQLSSGGSAATNFWLHSGPGVLLTRRLQPGQQGVRAIRFDTNGSPWFSAVTNINAVAGETNRLTLALKPGVRVRGQLDDVVPRPVRRGRVIAQVWPPGTAAKDSPPEWHTWSDIREDGTFQLRPLPDGQLEIVAVCDGFVSTNGPGQFPSMHYPQKQVLGTNDLELVIGMEPTAWLEVLVTDDQGAPLRDAKVMTWPNVRYGEWAATILGQDCYDTGELLRGATTESWWANPRGAFQATTDASGVALISNLPVEVRQFSVEHARFALPARNIGFGAKTRQASISLTPNITNRTTVRLEPLGRSAIAHY